MYIYLLYILILFEYFYNVNMANRNYIVLINCIVLYYIYSIVYRIFSGYFLKSCFGWIVSILGM